MFLVYYLLACMAILFVINLFSILHREVSCNIQPDNEKLLFTIVPPTGPKFELEILENQASGMKLYEEVSNVTGIPKAILRLYKNGKKVHRESFQVPDGGTIHAHIPGNGGTPPTPPGGRNMKTDYRTAQPEDKDQTVCDCQGACNCPLPWMLSSPISSPGTDQASSVYQPSPIPNPRALSSPYQPSPSEDQASSVYQPSPIPNPRALSSPYQPSPSEDQASSVYQPRPIPNPRALSSPYQPSPSEDQASSVYQPSPIPNPRALSSPYQPSPSEDQASSVYQPSPIPNPSALSSPYQPSPSEDQASSVYQPSPIADPHGCGGNDLDVYDFNESDQANALPYVRRALQKTTRDDCNSDSDLGVHHLESSDDDPSDLSDTNSEPFDSSFYIPASRTPTGKTKNQTGNTTEYY
ncbi:uncharacterized protein LOC144911083 [Branchiostoma floridae x Branchiostoma belcheri]